ncbi:MAG: Mini-ribonuclease 3 [Clostridia bacterium]|nr:Mini-ribonuclease 3 [Clostridia bacterium]
MTIEQLFACQMSEEELKQISPLVLAFVGDSIHTFFVRSKIVENGGHKVGDYHQKSASFCKASSQAKALDEILDSLSEAEADIVRRARNAKSHNIAKNSDIATYKKATSFEALLGYLYFTKNFERLKLILEKSI